MRGKVIVWQGIYVCSGRDLATVIEIDPSLLAKALAKDAHVVKAVRRALRDGNAEAVKLGEGIKIKLQS